MLIHPYRTSLSLFSLLGFLFRRNFLIQNILFSRKTNDIWCQLCSQYCHVFQKPNDCLSLSYNEKRKSLSDSFRLYWTDWNWHTNQLSMSLVIFLCQLVSVRVGTRAPRKIRFLLYHHLPANAIYVSKQFKFFSCHSKKKEKQKRLWRGRKEEKIGIIAVIGICPTLNNVLSRFNVRSVRSCRWWRS